MKSYGLFCTLLISAAIIVTSCNKEEEDTNSPTIGSMLVNGSDAQAVIEVLAGNTLQVTANITEDIELESYRIQVVADFTPVSATPFSYDQTSDAGGQSASVDETIAIPASTVSGPYNVILTAIDAAGREAESTISVSITSPTQATINVTAPVANFTVSFNDTIFVVGTVADDVDIVSVQFVAEPMQESGGLVAAGGPFYEGTFSLNESSDTNWDMAEVQTSSAHIVAPATGSTGSYKLEIRATDSDGNVTVKSIPFSLF